jgi:hypothetical protein
MASIRKRKTKEGTKYNVLYDYTDENGNHKQKSAGTFTSKGEAEAFMLEIDLKKKRNIFINLREETVSATNGCL